MNLTAIILKTNLKIHCNFVVNLKSDFLSFPAGLLYFMKADQQIIKNADLEKELVPIFSPFTEIQKKLLRFYYEDE